MPYNPQQFSIGSLLQGPTPTAVRAPSQTIVNQTQPAYQPALNQTVYQAPTTANNTSTNIAGGLPTAGYGGGGTSSTNQAAIDQARQSFLDKYGLLQKNQDFSQQQIDAGLAGAQATYDNKMNEANTYFGQQGDLLNQNQQLANQKMQDIYAARGLGSLQDSGYYQRDQKQADNNYTLQTENLQHDKASQIDALHNYLNQAQANAQLQKYNLNVDDFNTLDQYQSALAQIDQHIADIDSQRQRALAAVQGFNSQAATYVPTFDTAKANDALFTHVNQLAAQGNTKKDLQGYINQYYAGDKDKLKYYNDFINNLGLVPA